ncbi:MAG: TIGR00266 family protein [Ruminococcus sp.]|nr:TIGR00266 family protein [Ruminococcus sp.]MBR6384681.1 TIGR00266 family protein [Ruminococcus sp.]
MRYEIIGNLVPAVECTLSAGESMFTQSGGMVWQTEGVEMSTNARGGVMKSIGRAFSGESIFMANYTAKVEGAVVAFGSTVPGRVIPIDIGMNGTYICQKGAFLCAEQGINVDATVTKKASAGLFGGGGFILQKISGKGMVFLEVAGDVVERTLAPGEVIKVDTGNVVAFEEAVKYEVETVKGLKNIVFGGEGLFLTKLTGPGKIMLQTQSFSEFVSKIAARIPTSR